MLGALAALSASALLLQLLQTRASDVFEIFVGHGALRLGCVELVGCMLCLEMFVWVVQKKACVAGKSSEVRGEGQRLWLVDGRNASNDFYREFVHIVLENFVEIRGSQYGAAIKMKANAWLEGFTVRIQQAMQNHLLVCEARVSDCGRNKVEELTSH